MEFCKVTLTFESADEILWCDHSNETSLPVLTHGAIYFSKFHKMKFGNLVEICFWLNLAVKGLYNSSTQSVLITHYLSTLLSESDLTPVQCFLDRRFKSKYTSKPVGVYDFLERKDRKIFREVSNGKGHPLLSIMPRVKPSGYNRRKETCFKPKIINTRFVLKTLLSTV